MFTSSLPTNLDVARSVMPRLSAARAFYPSIHDAVNGILDSFFDHIAKVRSKSIRGSTSRLARSKTVFCRGRSGVHIAKNVQFISFDH